jgi:hypothetical protein
MLSAPSPRWGASSNARTCATSASAIIAIAAAWTAAIWNVSSSPNIASTPAYSSKIATSSSTHIP